MRRRQAILAFAVAAAVVMGLLTVFALELANTQAKSKRDVESRVHERAVLAAALIDSLFQTVNQQVPQEARIYGTRSVSDATLQRNVQQNVYLALLDRDGHVLASSRGFTAQARADLRVSAALKLVGAGHSYGLGNILPYGRHGIINFGVALPTAYGRRILLTGFDPTALTPFLSGELKKIPGVKGAQNYVLDGDKRVLASSNPKFPTGYGFTKPYQRHALDAASGDVRNYYYDQVALRNSTWRILLAAPDGPLFASVSGLRKWLPWVIFAAFALVALIAIMLARRALHAAADLSEANAQLGEANARLERVNDELEETNVALEQRARELARSNAELEGFASIASHDLQEPLRKVRTFTQQVLATEPDHLSDKGRDYLRRVNSAGERMQQLIEDLLSFSRVGTHGRPFTRVDLGQVAHEVMEDLSSQVERDDADVQIGKLPTIWADPLQMRQLLQNLASNALKFAREGVRPVVTIDATVEDRMMTLTVTDNGIGFEPQYRERIFRVFERLHGRTEYPGTGIGLALCRKIVERHGGTITAAGELGVGTTITVVLPVRPRGAAATDAPLEHEPHPDHEEVHVAA